MGKSLLYNRTWRQDMSYSHMGITVQKMKEYPMGMLSFFSLIKKDVWYKSDTWEANLMVTYSTSNNKSPMIKSELHLTIGECWLK